jgi:hypothetical protein
MIAIPENNQPCKEIWPLEIRCKWKKDVLARAQELNMTPEVYIMRQVSKDLYPIPEVKE